MSGEAKTLSGALMVCGTSSNSGKTTMVAGLCRLLARRGVRVAPFKAQNMALNSAVTASGHEIGRAQYLQAQAAGVEAEVAMNPILLKPTGERTSQVVVRGKPIGAMSAVEYHQAKPELFGLVLDSLADLRRRYDVVLIEGAGSPAEINLLANDIVNLRVAQAAEVPALLVGDIDLGGVFASLYGTVSILPDHLRELIRGFVINKLRGDPALLADGTDQLRARCGVPTLGVVPMLADFHLDAEDSLALAGQQGPSIAASSGSPSLDVAVVQLPHISNFTDLDALTLEPEVAVRYVRSARELGRPDLVILPGSKATVDDLAWLRRRGLDAAIHDLAAAGRTTVLGLCAGYQMLGRSIDDRHESGAGTVPGLGLLGVTTRFDAEKVLAAVTGRALGETIAGYQIHHGRVTSAAAGVDGGAPTPADWLCVDGEAEGCRQGPVFGTTVHGVLDADGFRRRFLADVAARAGATFTAGGPSVADHRNEQLDRLADHLAGSLDVAAIEELIATAAAPQDKPTAAGRIAEECP